jgi:hypothetical protein
MTVKVKVFGVNHPKKFVLLDFFGAFDSVYHELFILKLRHRWRCGY